MSSKAELSSERTDFAVGVETEPLTEKEKEQIARMLSDPEAFPREFKNWITKHASDSVDIAKTQVHGLVNGAGQLLIGSASMGVLGATLVGVCLPYAGVTAPLGWLPCDGSERARSDYVTLWQLLGTTWGAPSSGSVFKLPDFRGRAPFGIDANVPFAGNEGQGAGLRGPRHYHRVYDSRPITASGNMSGSGYTGEDGSNHTHAQPGGGFGVAAGGDATANIIEGGGWPGTYGINDPHWHPIPDITVSGTVAGTHTIDVNTYDDPGPLKGTVGWVGINWIIGSGKLP